MRTLRGFSLTVFETVEFIAEPFDCHNVYNAMPADKRPYEKGRIATVLSNWFHIGRLERVRNGVPGPGSQPAIYRRGSNFFGMARPHKPRHEKPPMLSRIEQAWREFRAGMQI